MRRIMSQQFQSVIRVPSENLKRYIVLNGSAKIPWSAIYTHGYGCLGQPCADAGGNV
jgi:hypothetical protein